MLYVFVVVPFILSVRVKTSPREEAISLIYEEAHEDANIIFGTVFDESMKDSVKITVIATGFDNQKQMTVPLTTAPEVIATGNTAAQTVAGSYHSATGTYNSADGNKEDINVPTFIRRQAD